MAKVTVEFDDSDWDKVSQSYAEMTDSTNDALDCLKHVLECVFGTDSVISIHMEPKFKTCGTTITDLSTLERRMV